MGIESGSQVILEEMNKKIKIDQIKTTLFNLAEAGIKTTTYWVIGYPEESEKDFEETLNLIEEMKDYIYEAECNPFKYYKGGLNGEDEWAKKSIYSNKELKYMLFQEWNHRDIIFDRVQRFTDFCTNIGIPNPYSLAEIEQADLR